MQDLFTLKMDIHGFHQQCCGMLTDRAKEYLKDKFLQQLEEICKQPIMADYQIKDAINSIIKSNLEYAFRDAIQDRDIQEKLNKYAKNQILKALGEE